MPTKEIRNQNAQRKWLGCRDVYLKSSNNLNYQKLAYFLNKKMRKGDSYKKIPRHNQLQIKEKSFNAKQKKFVIKILKGNG